jgi:hypothetical protein
MKMGILLAFAPFIGFAIVERLIGPIEGLVCGALIAAALLLRDVLVARKSAKVLEVGTVLLFAGLAVYTMLDGASWSVLGVRLRVDAGLLIIVLVSIAIRRPFTLQYAREQAPNELWNRPEFIRANYTITAIWTLAFAVIVAADFVMLALPEVPMRIGIIATIAALVGAIGFTTWYPKRLRRSFGNAVKAKSAPGVEVQ